MRESVIERKTRETDITVRLDLDGGGKADIQTGVPFLDHMLELFTRHGLFNITVSARGDLETGYHHTVEDVGICLGDAFADALGDKTGINRFGEATVPMDEALVSVSLDLSGRFCLVYKPGIRKIKIGDFNLGLIREFLKAFAEETKMSLHINSPYGRDPHHVVEAVFKALGRAMREAVSIDPRVKGIPSTKGTL